MSSDAFELAKLQAADIPRASVEEFIEFAKTNFVPLAYMFGNGFVLQAVEIAEELLYARKTCGQCGMLYCECGEYE